MTTDPADRRAPVDAARVIALALGTASEQTDDPDHPERPDGPPASKAQV